MSDPAAKPRDLKPVLQSFVLLDAVLRLFLWWSPIALTAAIVTATDSWPIKPLVGADFHTAWAWGQKLGQWAVLYNLIYVGLLVLLRVLTPTPKEGRYELGPGKKLDRQLLYSAVHAALTKARYQPPFPGFLVFHIANLPPMSWLVGRIFGPRSQSCYVTDPGILDPHMVSIGRNVIIGFGTTIAGHYQMGDAVHFKRTIIEDNVVIGAHVAMAGVHVKQGAMIGAGSVVLPDSQIGENEFWSGIPARRRRAVSARGAEDEQPCEVLAAGYQ
jgi:carbonic anhydrase/acetyltransferase-like protein (isoleucine patch superfamily)